MSKIVLESIGWPLGFLDQENSYFYADIEVDDPQDDELGEIESMDKFISLLKRKTIKLTAYKNNEAVFLLPNMISDNFENYKSINVNIDSVNNAYDIVKIIDDFYKGKDDEIDPNLKEILITAEIFVDGTLENCSSFKGKEMRSVLDGPRILNLLKFGPSFDYLVSIGSGIYKVILSYD